MILKWIELSTSLRLQGSSEWCKSELSQESYVSIVHHRQCSSRITQCLGGSYTLHSHKKSSAVHQNQIYYWSWKIGGLAFSDFASFPQIVFQCYVPKTSWLHPWNPFLSQVLFNLIRPNPDQQHFLWFQPDNSYLLWYLTWKTLLPSSLLITWGFFSSRPSPLAWLHSLTWPSCLIQEIRTGFLFLLFFCPLLGPLFPPLYYLFSLTCYSYFLLFPKLYLLAPCPET